MWLLNEKFNFCRSNVQRIISGKMLEKLAKEENSKLTVSYDAFPVNYNTTNLVLDTDYENYAVLWSCSNIGPVGHTESAWVREDCKAHTETDDTVKLIEFFTISISSCCREYAFPRVKFCKLLTVCSTSIS